MPDEKIPHWLEWARRIQAISQTGLTYCTNQFDIDRHRQLMEIAAEIVECYSDVEKEPLLENFYTHNGYATPKIDVRGAVIKDHKILLVKECSDQLWCLPGGWADIGESPAEAIEREVFEESGFQVTAKKIIAVLDANKTGRPLEFFHAYKIFFLCDLMGGNATTSIETTDVNFFAFDDIPPLSANRTNEKHLAEILAHVNDLQRPTKFD